MLGMMFGILVLCIKQAQKKGLVAGYCLGCVLFPVGLFIMMFIGAKLPTDDPGTICRRECSDRYSDSDEREVCYALCHCKHDDPLNCTR